jgi:hypothetical protein
MDLNTSRIIIPSELVSEFSKIAKNNVDGNNRVVETIAFLIGFTSEEGQVGTEILFPNQNGTASRVEDNGKSFFSIIAPLEHYHCTIFCQNE